MRTVTIQYKEYQDLISKNKVKEIEELNFIIESLKEDLNDEIMIHEEIVNNNKFLTLAMYVLGTSVLFLLGILAIIINN